MLYKQFVSGVESEKNKDYRNTIIGSYSYIGHGARFENCRVEDSVRIGSCVVFKGDTILGNNVHIGKYAKFLGEVLTGNNVQIGDYSEIRGTFRAGDKFVVGKGSEFEKFAQFGHESVFYSGVTFYIARFVGDVTFYFPVNVIERFDVVAGRDLVVCETKRKVRRMSLVEAIGLNQEMLKIKDTRLKIALKIPVSP